MPTGDAAKAEQKQRYEQALAELDALINGAGDNQSTQEFVAGWAEFVERGEG